MSAKIFGGVDPIAELERNIRQLRDQGMSAEREADMRKYLDMLRPKIVGHAVDKPVAAVSDTFYWIHTFNMREMGGPFPTVSEAEEDAKATFGSADVALKDLDGMIDITRTVKTLRADVEVTWEEVNPCGLQRLPRGGWGCLECDLSAASYPDRCQRPKLK